MVKKTKIVATMGPAIESKEILREAILNGLNVLRINFSHAQHAEVLKNIAYLNELNKELATYTAWLCDTKGPEIRVNKLRDTRVYLEKDNYLDIYMHEIIGDAKAISMSYSRLNECVTKGSKILIDDGLIELEVINVYDDRIQTKIMNSGYLLENKGINVPNAILRMDFLSQKDINDIKFACQNGASYIAASFTRRKEDIAQIRKLCLQNNRNDMQIIAKIENQEGIDNLDSILAEADGIMIARGDLGTEIPMEDVPLVQMKICEKCNNIGKPVIVATHMLDSMEKHPRPTRAEVGDVARAVIDGVDAVMLSGETAKGEYPIQALTFMSKIVSRSEETIDHNKILKKFIDGVSNNPYDGIGISAVELAAKIDAKAIFCFTESGATAHQISKYRPTCPIYALSQYDSALYSLALYWGVIGIKKGVYQSIESKYEIVNMEAKNIGLNKGDFVIVTGGHPDGTPITNFLKIHAVEY
ncbi:pyruvate kinase [Erysipelotrichaceae bacterium OttesenSCG-928-M19]|nr:pyruvate kinase [Erysipelotrichaceae bacterium OttesenSCG-928-M19]